MNRGSAMGGVPRPHLISCGASGSATQRLPHSTACLRAVIVPVAAPAFADTGMETLRFLLAAHELKSIVTAALPDPGPSCRQRIRITERSPWTPPIAAPIRSRASPEPCSRLS